MLVDLVQVQTRDGVRLDGMLQVPEAAKSSLRAEAFCFIHGTGGNFYGSTLFDEIAGRLLSQGAAVLRVNTRGHDGISTAMLRQGGRRQGAAYEVVDDCRLDLAAWLDWLRERFERIALIGHSSGAVKCLYSVAHEPSIQPACVIGLSPPRLSYSWFCSSPEAQDFLATYRKAEELVQGGQPAALMDVKLPLPFVITAAGFVEKYGPDERYNFLRFVKSVRCPTLVTFGSVEVANNMAFRQAPEELKEVAKNRSNLTTAVVADADHFYSGVREQLLGILQTWWST